ncbi:MAG: VWA domain-containing protein [Phycisphaeraceae bacterium]|nr:VWA domain-containing protein [Phycisphaeraceae bacterium]
MPHQFSLNVVPLLPVWAVLAVGALLLLLLAQGSLLLLRKKVPSRWVAILGVLRVAIVIVFVVCLLQPTISFHRDIRQLPDLVLMVDTSMSMNNKTSSGQTRLADTLSDLRSSSLMADLQKQYNIHWFAFDRTAYPIESADLATLKAVGDTTRFSDSLTTAWDYQRQADGQTTTAGKNASARVVLISDGNDLGTDDVVDAARRLGVTIDTLAPKPSIAGQSASRVVISSVQSPRRVLLGSEAQFVITLRADGTPSGPVTVELLDDNKPVLSQEVVFKQGENEKQVIITDQPTEVGLRPYEIHLSGAAAPAADAAKPYKLSVGVLDTKTEVLFIEETWRWAFKFLRQVLEDDPSFSMTAMLSRGPGRWVQFGEPDRKVQLGGFPQSKSEIEWYDTIVLGDVNPKRWPRSLAPAIHHLVAEEGKSLVLIAGPSLAAVAETPEIASLLPVELTRESALPVEGPIEIRKSREGAASPFFFNQVGSLPALDRIYPPLRKRPAATILLEATRQGNNYGNIIVMAEHTVGKGRVLFIGTDTLWKWQMFGQQDEHGVTPYKAFWQQALRALAPIRPSTGAVNLYVQAERTRYEAGKRVVLHAQIKSDRPITQPVLTATVTLPNDKQIPLALAADPTKPNSYSTEFESTMAGRHKITASVNSEGKLLAEVVTPIDIEEPRGEASGTDVDAANLARIASATGGKAINLDDAKTWPTSVTTDRVTLDKRHDWDLWNNFTLLVVLCLLLGTDWLLRLLRGYV